MIQLRRALDFGPLPSVISNIASSVFSDKATVVRSAYLTKLAPCNRNSFITYKYCRSLLSYHHPESTSQSCIMAQASSAALNAHSATTAVASLGEGRGAGPPRVTPSRGDARPKINFLWLNLERTLDKRRGKVEVARSRQLKRSPLLEAMTKKSRLIFLFKINRVTPIDCRFG